MVSILEKFAQGEINPNDQFLMDSKGEWIRNIPDYHKAICRVTDAEEELRKFLGTQNWNLLEEYTNACGDVDSITETHKFVQGYQLGALMMMELFLGADESYGSRKR